jgi:hypothetical protein
MGNYLGSFIEKSENNRVIIGRLCTVPPLLFVGWFTVCTVDSLKCALHIEIDTLEYQQTEKI